jgi:hypothetical protein
VKRIGRALLIWALILTLRTVSGQNFTNLNFESAVIVPDTALYPEFGTHVVYASNALPGWTISGDLGQNALFYNTFSLGAPSVSLFGVNTNVGILGSPPPLDGHFSVDLYGGVPGDSENGPYIAQTGLVPASAKSIEFIAAAAPYGGATVLLVSLGGHNIPFTAISGTPDYTRFAGDVSAFAGQVEQLEFYTPFNTGINNYWEIDDIQFSPNAIPEPGVLVLAFSGAAILGIRRLRKRVKCH